MLIVFEGGSWDGWDTEVTAEAVRVERWARDADTHETWAIDVYTRTDRTESVTTTYRTRTGPALKLRTGVVFVWAERKGVPKDPAREAPQAQLTLC